ncbi:MAG: hypothetical protein WC383_16245 [Gammaproteobacteria bacterium]
MKVASVAHIIFSIVFAFYMVFLPIFDMSMLLKISESTNPFKTIIYIINNSNSLSFANLGTVIIIPLIMFYLFIIASTVVILELKCSFDRAYKKKIIVKLNININKIYRYVNFALRKIYKLNCKWRN